MEPKDTPQYYIIKMEVMAPVELTYRVLASNAEEALQIVEKTNVSLLGLPKPNLTKAKRILAKVYKSGSSLVDFLKKY